MSLSFFIIQFLYLFFLTFVQFATRVIRERRALWATEEGRAELESRNKLDFVDILLTSTDENGKPLTDKEIRDECNTFIFEGHGM